MADSTDWGPTTRAFRSLMDQWKRAPRGSRSDEDKLWKKFKAAQDSFYSAMKAADAAKDAELAPNVEMKEALVVPQVKRQLRSIQEQWDKAGDLPRSDRSRLESRLKKVEDAVRKAESSAWDRDDPDKRARAESTANAFTDALAKQEADLEQARAAGDERAVRKLEQSIESTRALLEAAQRIAQ